MNDPKQNGTLTSILTLSRATWEATHGDRVRFFGFVLLSVLAYSIDLVVPWAIGWILNVFVAQGFTQAAFDESLKYMAAYVVLRMSMTTLHHLARYLQ